MSRSRTMVLLLTAIAAAIMLLFPPFEIRLGAATLNMGYGFLFSPPRQGSISASISLGVLVAQWAVLALLGFVAWIVVSRRAGRCARIDSAAIPMARGSQTDPRSEQSQPSADIVRRPNSPDISRRQLGLGLLLLFATIVVLRGPNIFNLSPYGRVQVLADHVGFAAAMWLFGLLVAAIGAGIERANKRPKTAFRRNTLIGAWLCAAFAAIGLISNSNKVSTTTAHPGSAQYSLDDRSTPAPAPTAPEQSVSTRLPEKAEQSAGSIWAQPPIGLMPWAKIANKPQYVGGTVAQRAAIRDLYWQVCLAPLILPDKLDIAEGEFLSAVTAIESRIPPAAQPPSSGRKSVSEYLREKERDRRAAVSADMMNRWCRDW